MKEIDFNSEWNLYYEGLFYLILSIVGKHPATAEDILHDVYLKAYLSRNQLRNPQKMKSWLFKIAKNKSIDEVNRSKHLISIEQSLIENMPLDETGYEHLDKIMIADYLNTLPSDFRRILYLHIYYDFTSRELSQMYEINYTALRKQLYRAKKRIETIQTIFYMIDW